jgi:hypothetical protein
LLVPDYPSRRPADVGRQAARSIPPLIYPLDFLAFDITATKTMILVHARGSPITRYLYVLWLTDASASKRDTHHLAGDNE